MGKNKSGKKSGHKTSGLSQGTGGNVVFAFAVKLFCVAICVLIFSNLSYLFNEVYIKEKDLMKYMLNSLGFLVAGALLGVLIAPHLQTGLEQTHAYILSVIRRYSAQTIAAGSIGVVVGVILAVVAVLPIFIFFQDRYVLGFCLAIGFSLLFGYLGAMIFSRVSLWGEKKPAVSSRAAAYTPEGAHPKVIDSSVLIDGRIYNLVKAGFIEGKLVVPSYVLHEIQMIADDSDPVRRQRGRNGLDILGKVRDECGVPVEIIEAPRPKVIDADTSVDSRLVELAKSIGGVLVTNDYNLGKIAELKDVRVFNLNVLANTLRKTLLPGEIVEVNVVKYGKEAGQGIAYLDDGTMVVVESGDKFVGDSVAVEISSIMATVAGRLIFARVLQQGGGQNSGHNGNDSRH